MQNGSSWTNDQSTTAVEDKPSAELLENLLRQQQAILNNIPDIAWLKDRESRFIAVNWSFGSACGEDPETLRGKTDHDIWPKDLADRYRNDDREVISSGKRKIVEEPLAGRDGTLSWIETIKTPIYNAAGEVIGTTGIARDITDRKAREDKLRRSERLSSIGTLAASIAHEINNPLGGILLAARLALLSKGNPPVTNRALTDITDYAARAKAIVESILTIVRHQSSEKKEADLNESVLKALDLLRNEAERSGCVLIGSMAEHLPSIRMNRTEIEQVVVNLIRNSIQAGSTEIQVSTGAAEREVFVKVADNGEGLASEQIEKIFEPFHSTRQARGGTGLGLSISRHIIHDHNGTIAASNLPGGGACFIVRFQQLERTEV